MLNLLACVSTYAIILLLSSFSIHFAYTLACHEDMTTAECLSMTQPEIALRLNDQISGIDASFKKTPFAIQDQSELLERGEIHCISEFLLIVWPKYRWCLLLLIPDFVHHSIRSWTQQKSLSTSGKAERLDFAWKTPKYRGPWWISFRNAMPWSRPACQYL